MCAFYQNWEYKVKTAFFYVDLVTPPLAAWTAIVCTHVLGDSYPEFNNIHGNSLIIINHFDHMLLFLRCLIFSTRQAWADDHTKCHQMFKNVKILEFGGYIWNHREKCIEISTNMLGIGLAICEIKEFWETKHFVLSCAHDCRVESITNKISPQFSQNSPRE